MHIDTRGPSRRPSNKGKAVAVAAMLGAMVGTALCAGAVVALCGVESLFIVGDFFSLILFVLGAIFGLGFGAVMGAGIGYVIN